MSRVASPRQSQSSLSRQPWVRVLQDYFYQSAQPLTSLVFLALPLVLYEVGTRLMATEAQPRTEVRVLAFSYLREFLSLFGASGQYLPAFTVVGILICWHLARRDRWQLHLATAFGMSGESLLMAMPLLVLSIVIGRYVPLAAAHHGLAIAHDPVLSRGIVLAFGAGIYEELVFRLMGLTLLNIVLVDLLRIQRRPATIVMVLASAVLFAMYHYWAPAAAPFRWSDFIFRSLSGIYFALLFIHRGFGITAGTHIAYDSYCFILRSLAGL